MGYQSRKDTLDNICTIEAIHAVGAHHTGLGASDLAGLGIDELSLAKAGLQVCHEVTIAEHLFLRDGDQFGQVLVLHLLALPVEVEPDVVDVGVCQRCVHLSKLLPNAFLTALLIDEVD